MRAIEPIGPERIRESAKVAPVTRRLREDDDSRRQPPEQRRRQPPPAPEGEDDGRPHIDVTV